VAGWARAVLHRHHLGDVGVLVIIDGVVVDGSSSSHEKQADNKKENSRSDHFSQGNEVVSLSSSFKMPLNQMKLISLRLFPFTLSTNSLVSTR
jgi:hypothetical protein